MLIHLFGGLLCPTAIGCGTGGAGVQDFSNADLKAIQSGFGSFFSKTAYSNQPFGFQDFNHVAYVTVTYSHQGIGLGGGQFIRRTVTTGFLHKYQRTVVGNKVICKENLGRIKTFGKEAPQAATAYFAAVACKAINGALGMFIFRF